MRNARVEALILIHPRKLGDSCTGCLAGSFGGFKAIDKMHLVTCRSLITRIIKMSSGKVVCACSRSNPNVLMPILGNGSSNSVLLRFVDAVIGKDDCEREINNHFRILIRDG